MRERERQRERERERERVRELAIRARAHTHTHTHYGYITVPECINYYTARAGLCSGEACGVGLAAVLYNIIPNLCDIIQ